MNTQVDFSLVLPCFNEEGLFEDSVARIVAALDAGAYTYEIIFVDDKSTDETKKLIGNKCKKMDSPLPASPAGGRGNDRGVFRAVYHTMNMGRGRSVMDGIRAARADIVGYVDIDCEVSPIYLPFMISLVKQKKADIVIGRRFYRSTAGSVIREVLSRGYQWLADVMVGTGKLDTESGYKIFRKKKIVPIFDQIEHQGWFWDTEIMTYAQRAGLRITEVPVLFLRRFDKQSSVHIVRDTIDYLIHLWKFRGRLLK